LIDRLIGLGFDADDAEEAVRAGTPGQLSILTRLAERATSGTEAGEPTGEYLATLDWLGEEYVGPLTRRGLSATADLTPENLQDGAEVLAETARMLRSIPLSRREAMWQVMEEEVRRASPHYENARRAMVDTGITVALQAEDHVILTGLHPSVIPAVDRGVLQTAGYANPQVALQHLVKSARATPRHLRAGETLEQILAEGYEQLRQQPPRPKRWTGLAKLLTGGALAAIDIAGGVAATAGGGPLTSGVTLGGVLTSCGTGIGMIAEGVGVLRGE
jgi:hypothetical protein